MGRVKVLLDTPSMNQLDDMFPLIRPGGRFRPSECEPRSRVALIVPYRDREEHLRAFLHNLHPILSRQQIDYGIFVIESIPDVKFNRAKLMNIGFREAVKTYDYQCFIFHDVDLLPEDDRNLLVFPRQPASLASSHTFSPSLALIPPPVSLLTPVTRLSVAEFSFPSLPLSRMSPSVTRAPRCWRLPSLRLQFQSRKLVSRMSV